MARKAASGSGTIRKKTVTRNGKEYTYWEARFTIGYDPGTGKQIQKSITGKTQKEVSQKLKAMTTEVDEGIYNEPSKLTVAQWMDIWTSEYLLSQKYGTIKHYKAQVNNHIIPALGAKKLTALTPHDIQRFYNMLLREGHTVKCKDDVGKKVVKKVPLSEKSVRNVHGILTKALSQAVKNGYIRTNPAEAAELPKKKKTEITPLSDKQVKQYIIQADSDSYGDLLKVILFTGMRENEALGLTWDCVDFQNGKLYIKKQLLKRKISEGGFTFAPLKNNKARTLCPAPFVMDILKGVREKQIRARLYAGEVWQGWQNEEQRAKWYVFATDLGQHLSPQTVYIHHKKIAAAAGAPDARLHDLRHTYAVLSLQNGDDIKTVQVALGHATAAFTLDVYGHVSEKMQKDSADRMQQYYASIKQA